MWHGGTGRLLSPSQRAPARQKLGLRGRMQERARGTARRTHSASLPSPLPLRLRRVAPATMG
eukprot:10700869-Alexandrium_andersonii.AAC.1